MSPAKQNRPSRRIEMVILALLVGLILTACSGSASRRTASVAVTTTVAGPAPATAVVAQVGNTPIDGATYDHWLAIGAATVEMPKPTGSLPKPVAYEPPDFAACITHLQARASKLPTAQLKANCEKTYQGIRTRILDFLITGYWLRDEAAEKHASVTDTEVRNKFEEAKRTQYPTAASFRRLEEASHQTVADLEFAVETQMLSAKLLESFMKEDGKQKSEQAAIAAFNKSISSRWTPKTSCRPGYVVKDCKQYKPPATPKAGK